MENPLYDNNETKILEDYKKYILSNIDYNSKSSKTTNYINMKMFSKDDILNTKTKIYKSNIIKEPEIKKDIIKNLILITLLLITITDIAQANVGIPYVVAGPLTLLVAIIIGLIEWLFVDKILNYQVSLLRIYLANCISTLLEIGRAHV